MTFVPRLDILPDEQRALWPALVQVPESLVLYGGTALALRLGHRTSVDFDLFSSEALDFDALFACASLQRITPAWPSLEHPESWPHEARIASACRRAHSPGRCPLAPRHSICAPFSESLESCRHSKGHIRPSVRTKAFGGRLSPPSRGRGAATSLRNASTGSGPAERFTCRPSGRSSISTSTTHRLGPTNRPS